MDEAERRARALVSRDGKAGLEWFIAHFENDPKVYPKLAMWVYRLYAELLKDENESLTRRMTELADFLGSADVETKYEVHHSYGVEPAAVFSDLAQAVHFWKQATSVDSYIREGQKRRADIIEVKTRVRKVK